MVAAESPESARETGTFAEPAPAFVWGVAEPYEEEVPYSNHHSVAAPPGLTVPFRVADEPPTALTGPVIAVGAAAIAATPATTQTRAEAERAPEIPRLLRIR